MLKVVALALLRVSVWMRWGSNFKPTWAKDVTGAFPGLANAGNLTCHGKWRYNYAFLLFHQFSPHISCATKSVNWTGCYFAELRLARQVSVKFHLIVCGDSKFFDSTIFRFHESMTALFFVYIVLWLYIWLILLLSYCTILWRYYSFHPKF